MLKKVLILLAMIILCFSVNAQKHGGDKRHPNLPNFDKTIFHYGFCLGGNSTGFIMDYDLTTYDSLISIQTNGQAGFNIGLIASMRLNSYFTLRFTPTLAFAQRNVEYVFINPISSIKETRIIESTYISFPLLVKFRSQRVGNFAAYIIGGTNFSYDLSSKLDLDNNVVPSAQVLKSQRNNLYAELGFGTDFFLDYFKFSVELKYGYGLHNTFLDDDSFWAKPIKEFRPTMFTISFNFEG